MPVPTPHKGERQADFHSRCMADETMTKDYADMKQRNAVCYGAWDAEHPESPRRRPARGAATMHPHVLIPDTPACWHHHLGLWCVAPEPFLLVFRAWQQGEPWGRLRALDTHEMQALEPGERRAYEVTPEGTAFIALSGPLTKGGSMKFEGTSTVMVRRALRMAMQDEQVQSVVLHIDSPGGHVAGIEALAADIATLKTQKPIVAQLEDLGASAAYWLASQADAIYASTETTEVGSLGVMAVVEDSSQRMDRLGVKVHVISTGPFKGAGADGAPVTDATLAYLHERINGVNAHFMQAVQRGRGLSPDHVAALADGRVHLAEQARRLRMIDGIQPLETTLAQLASPGAGRDTARRGRAARLAQMQARSVLFQQE